MTSKVVICGAGFLGSHIARALTAPGTGVVPHIVQVSSRNPQKVYDELKKSIPEKLLAPPVPVDITKPSTLRPAFEGASTVISLVGIMHGSPKAFEEIQWKGALNIAEAAKSVGARLIHISAIGADENSKLPYARTKALGEISVFEHCPNATIIRPSIVFGPEDDFFNRFSKLSKYLPFLPVFGGGKSRFQPVYVDDVARAVEIIARNDPGVDTTVSGKITEAGGPDILTYRQVMETVLRYNGRRRPIISLPFWVGTLQGAILEKLPQNLFTVTRAQIEQLKNDNIIARDHEVDSQRYFSFASLIEKHSSSSLKSVHDVLPSYFM